MSANRRSARLAALNNTNSPSEPSLPPQIPVIPEEEPASIADTTEPSSNISDEQLRNEHPRRSQILPDTDDNKSEIDDTNAAQPLHNNTSEPANNDNANEAQQRNRGVALGPSYLTNPRQYANAVKNFSTRWFKKFGTICSQTQLAGFTALWDRQLLGLGVDYTLAVSRDLEWPLMDDVLTIIEFTTDLYYEALVFRLTSGLTRNLSLSSLGNNINNNTVSVEANILLESAASMLLKSYEFDANIGMKCENILANKLSITSRQELYNRLNIEPDQIPVLADRFRDDLDNIAPVPVWNFSRRLVAANSNGNGNEVEEDLSAIE
eukprot:45182_1